MCAGRRDLSICGRRSELFVFWNGGGLLLERVAVFLVSSRRPYDIKVLLLTGDNGGVANVGLGSSVDNADAPVSPLSSPPRLPDFRLRRAFWSIDIVLTPHR